ncbi:MAG: L,D-transpeptidase [Pseudomonadota bacterium]
MIALCVAGAALAPSMAVAAKPAKKAKAVKVAAPVVLLTAQTVNAAGKDAAALPAAGAKPDPAATLRAQILLDRAHFSSGEIDGATGTNLRMAISGFQRQRGLSVNGTLDAPTWAALNADTAEALGTYTLTDADVAGPFQAIPEDMADKAKLAALGYASALEGLGEKFHVSPALLQRLNPGKDLATLGEQILVPNVLGTEPLPKAGKILVDRSDRTVALYDVAGKVIAQFPSSTGTDKDPLPVGNWKVNGISKNPKFHYNPALFWDAEPGDKKATIAPGPNNPVGLAWIDLSKPHYGIHGTPVPSAIGKTQSHGCIRLTNWDVMTVTESVGPGTAVVMQE